MRILMAVFGIILLLPGICALIFAVGSRFDSTLMGLWVICFLISAVGVALLYGAFRGPRTGGPAGR
jgi:hypothetical protein